MINEVQSANSADIFPRILAGVNSRRVLRVKKRGGDRWLYFVPGFVIKYASTPVERASLLNEHERSAAAAGTPFWAGDAVANRMLTRAILVTSRHSNTTPAELDQLTDFVEGKLQAAAGYPMQPAIDYLRRCRLFATAPEERRHMIAERLEGHFLPRTSMHGDFHFMNLVRGRGRVRVIDWEFFDPEGTFVFDYLDFHFHLEGGGMDNESFLMRLAPEHPVVARVAEVVGIAPRALILCYGIHELSKKAARLGPEALSPELEARMEQVVERLLTVQAAGVPELRAT